MIDASLKKAIQLYLVDRINQNVIFNSIEPVSGGSINSAFKINTNQFPVFVKINDAISFPQMLEKEALSLNFLSNKSSFKVPAVLGLFEVDKNQLLILEWIESGITGNTFWQTFAIQLTELHQQTNPEFGFEFNNYIGSLFQSNSFHKSWISFFIEERLKPQIKLARDKSLFDINDISQFESLFKKLDSIFPAEVPALIHGDLWSGNFLVNKSNEPVLIDPAIYYGHREMELSFMQLFDGFGQKLFDAYDEIFPLANGFQNRKDIYNLYPLLVHLNLFGGSYYGKIKDIIKVFK